MLYKLAQINLQENTKAKLNKEFEDYEGQRTHQENRIKYIGLVKRLQERYG